MATLGAEAQNKRNLLQQPSAEIKQKLVRTTQTKKNQYFFINSLAPRRFEWNFRLVIFKQIW